MVRAVIHTADQNVPVHLVDPARGKAIRAEPIRAMVGGMTRALDQLARVVPTLGLSGTSFSILIIVGSLLRGAALVPRSRRGASTQDSVPPPPAAPRADPARHADILGPALPHQGPISPVHRPGAGTSRRRSEPAPLRPRFRRAGLGNYLARPSCVATRVAFTEG